MLCVEPRDFYFALVGDPQPDDAFDERSLAGTIRTKQAKDLAFADVQRDVPDRLDLTVRFS